MKNLHILVVDDDRDFAEGMAEFMELHGLKVQLAFSGEEAVRKFREHDFDITFMDVKLPGMNGVKNFLEIRKHSPHAKVVIMTGYSIKQLLDEAVEKGAWEVIHKPLNMRHVLKMLQKIKPHGILIADDDPDFVACIREVLERKGYTVYAARDGKEAVERVQSNGIDILILDLRMPVLNGLGVCLELKESGRSIPTIIVTAYVNEEADSLDRLRSLSVRRILTKPHDPEELLHAVENLSKP